MADLTEEQIADFKEAFSLFDKDGDNRIKTSELGLLVRALNQNPTEAEVRKFITEIDPEETGMFSFPDFVALMARNIQTVDAEEELLDALRVFEREGTVQAATLKHLVCHMGEKFTEEEADDMIRRANPDADGNINYEAFARLLISKFS